MKQAVLIGVVAIAAAAETGSVGIFEGAGDVGNPDRKGEATYDAAGATYRVTGAGANMWDKTDQFQFLWKRISGNAAITAEVHFPKAGGAAHRKAVLMFRQALDTSAPYVDAAVHGSGLTAIQFRETEGDITRGVRFPVEGPSWVRLERQGPWFTLFTSTDGKKFVESGGVQVKLKDPVYVGIGVCSHDAKTAETAAFSHVKIEPLAKAVVKQ